MARYRVLSIILATLVGSSLSSANGDRPYYVISGRPRSILTDCSGVAYRPETKTYFVIENRTCNVYEISLRRRILNMFPTHLKGDTEGITYAGKGLFYVCGEVGNRIYELELRRGKFVRKRSAEIAIPDKPVNCGLEGIAYCRPRNSLFCVKEMKPVLILEIDLAEGCFGKIKRKKEVKSVRDLAGAAYDEKSNLLFVLSQMDRRVLVLKPDTLEQVSWFPVGGGQPEGLCFGPAGQLCVFSEPTHCLLYEPGNPPKRGQTAMSAPALPKVTKPLLVLDFDAGLDATIGPKPTKGKYPLAPGKKGKAVDLTGQATGLYVEADGVLDGDNLAGEFWFKPTWNAPGKGTRELLRIRGKDGAFMILEYNNNSKRLQIEARAKPTGFMVLGGSVKGLIRAGRWHHVAFQWRLDGPGKNTGSLALDGRLLAARPSVQNWPKGGFDLSKCRIYIGSCGGRSISALVDGFKLGR